MIRYRLAPASPETHRFHVSVTLDQVAGEQLWRLPAWVPGSYMIRDFARNILELKAEANGQPLALTQLDKQSWQTAAPVVASEVTLSLVVHAHDDSVRAAFLDNRYGFFDGASLLLEPVGRSGDACELTLLPPAGTSYDVWQAATSLAPGQVDGRGFGRYVAANYADLIDHPVLMGRLESASFDVEGCEHRVVLSGQQRADMARLCRDVQAICQTHVRLFREPPPMPRYAFLTRVTEKGYGGLEHRNSCALVCARDTLPRRQEAGDKLRDGYRTLLGLFSHEYFHLWNIKRIRPAAFTPYDLTRENYTELLWAFEGITSYYDDLALVRSGVIDVSSYLELLGQSLTRVARGHGRFRQTVTASSFDAWTKFYKQDESAPNVLVSYYTKGAWVALALDLLLRQKSGGRKSLDDVMRLLWQRYGKTAYSDHEAGVPEQGIQAAAEEIAGESLDAFFQQALYTTEDVDLSPLLASMGVQLHWRAASGHGDNGGKPAAATLHLGALTAADSHGVKLRVLYEQGSAMRAGLAAGDVLVAIDGLKASHANLDTLLAAYAPGDRVRLHAFRGDELMQFDLTLELGEPDFAYLQLDASGLTPAGREWLHGG